MTSELEHLKATQIPDSILFTHLRLDPEYALEEDKAAARSMLQAAVSYVQERCAINEEYMDAHPDIALAVLAITRDLYDHRSFTVDSNIKLNPMVLSILSVHDFNLI